PSGFQVTDISDSPIDAGSLRAAVNQANADTTPNDTFTISFAPALAGKTITLGSSLYLTNTTQGLTIVIDGSAAPGVTIAGGGSSSIFSDLTLYSGTTVSLDALTIKNGFTPSEGGGVDCRGTLTIMNCTFSGNSADFGGAVNAGPDSSLTIRSSTFTG